MASEAGAGATAKAGKTVVALEGAVGKHSFLKEEQVAFCEHINICLGHDTFLTSHGYLPMDPQSDALFRSIADGILLSKLINLAQRDTIDERALNTPPEGRVLNPWEMTENQNIVINSARSIGCQVVNIHAKDLIHAAEQHKEYLVLGLIWQIVKVQLLSQITLKEHPELFRLLQEGEELNTLLRLPPEDILIRWVNHHLRKEGSTRTVTNLASDLKDGEVYLTLLHSIDPAKCPAPSAVAATDPMGRSVAVLDAARAIDVPTFIQPADIVSGNKRLNLAFVAQIFNTRHGLEAKEEEIKAVYDAAGLTEEAEDDAREERVFRMWMNSLNLAEGGLQVNHLMNDLADGVVLLETIKKVRPGVVEDKRIQREKLNNFKRIENCNYAVSLGRELGLSLPGLGGIDIANRNPKLILGFVWQLMRLQVVQLLQSVGGGTIPKDADIIAWANKAVSDSGKSASITSFKDPSISSGVFLLDLLAAVEPRAINPTILTTGETEEDRRKNAKYVISVARKIGAQVFLTWEDIVDVKQKMIMTLVASIMHTAKEMASGGASGASTPSTTTSTASAAASGTGAGAGSA